MRSQRRWQQPCTRRAWCLRGFRGYRSHSLRNARVGLTGCARLRIGPRAARNVLPMGAVSVPIVWPPAYRIRTSIAAHRRASAVGDCLLAHVIGITSLRAGATTAASERGRFPLPERKSPRPGALTRLESSTSSRLGHRHDHAYTFHVPDVPARPQRCGLHHRHRPGWAERGACVQGTGAGLRSVRTPR